MKCDNWLNKVLENRELRQNRQWGLIEKFNSTVLSLSINIPGCKKDSEDAKFIYETAIKEINKFGLKEYEKILTCKDTGYEALWALHVDAKELKILTCKVEENHPLGRFMDIDVIDSNKKSSHEKLQENVIFVKKMQKNVQEVKSTLSKSCWLT